jgi:hypothetical protein
MYYGPTTGIGSTDVPIITSVFDGAPPRTFYTTRLLLACGLAVPLPTVLANFRCNTTVTAYANSNFDPPLGSQILSFQPKDRPDLIGGTQIPLRGFPIDLSRFSNRGWRYLVFNTEFEALVSLTGTYVPLPSYLDAYVFVDGIEVVITEG